MDTATTTRQAERPATGRRVILRAGALGAFLVLCVARSGSGQATTSLPDGQARQDVPGATNPIPATPLLIGPGDVLDVEVFSTPELSGRVRADQSGLIRLPLGGAVDVNGVTSAQASSLIEKKLRDAQVMLDPHVTTFVTEYATQGITVLGEVRAPGTYLLIGPHSLYDAISAAGGTTATAGATITITHKTDAEHPINIPVNSPNYSQVQRLTAIEPGDTVLVSKAFTISVVGDVARPGTFYLQDGEPMTVLNALALVSGLNRTAKVSKAAVIRLTSNGAQTIPINLNKIMNNTEPNFLLQASDILVVPRSGAKVFLETALPSATGAVTSAVASALIVR